MPCNPKETLRSSVAKRSSCEILRTLLASDPVDPSTIRELLERVRAGEASVEDALARLKDLPFADLGYAMVDHHRALRQGVPEVILGDGKSVAQIAGIARELARTGQNVLITRLDDAKSTELKRAMPEIAVNAPARTASIEQKPIP